MIQKVQAFIYRQREDSLDLLIFEHDITKIHQLVRGTVEEGEDLELAVIREVAEESGLRDVKVEKKLGELVLEIKSGPTRSGPLEKQLHHAFLIKCNEETQDKWTHIAEGSSEEEGLKFHFYWASHDKDLEAIVFDDFKPFISKFLQEVL